MVNVSSLALWSMMAICLVIGLCAGIFLTLFEPIYRKRRTELRMAQATRKQTDEIMRRMLGSIKNATVAEREERS